MSHLNQAIIRCRRKPLNILAQNTLIKKCVIPCQSHNEISLTEREYMVQMLYGPYILFLLADLNIFDICFFICGQIAFHFTLGKVFGPIIRDNQFYLRIILSQNGIYRRK